MAKLLELISIGSEERVLDVATGTGVVPAALARRADPPAGVIGVDRTEAMLDLAPALPEGWSLQAADATELPFEDASFDVVTAAYLLHVIEPEERRRVIGEIRRVLRPGGRLGTITIAPPRSALVAYLSAPLVAATRRSHGMLAALRPLDPGDQLGALGFEETARGRTAAGYPSLYAVFKRA